MKIYIGACPNVLSQNENGTKDRLSVPNRMMKRRMIERGFLKHAARIRETLKTQNYYVDDNDQIWVRIPSVPGRIHKINTDGELLEVVYVYERWYDPKKKQTRNRQVIIGHSIEACLPGMFPTDHYYEYFDFTSGMLLKRPEPELAGPPENEPEAPDAEKTRIIPAENLPANKQERAETRIMMPNYIQDEDPDEAETPEYKLQKTRFEILTDILDNIHTSIKNQAKKRPDAVVNPYKAQKINALLTEIRDFYEDTGVEDLMELIETPHVVEEDGRNTLVGTTYSDADILLEYYASIMNHIN